MAEEKKKKNYSKYNKKYYWLKFKQDFFEEDTIKWLEEQEGGKDYVYFYLKLCSKAISTDGILIRKVGDMLIPYNEKTIADLTNTNIDTVRVAMQVLIKVKLITILENGAIFLEQIIPLIGTESNKAELMRRKRQRDKLLTASSKKDILGVGNNVTNMLPTGYQEVTNPLPKSYLDIDKDIDIDTEEIRTMTFDTLYNLINEIIKQAKEDSELLERDTDIFKELKRLNYYISDISFFNNDILPKESKEYFMVVIYAINEIINGKNGEKIYKLTEEDIKSIFLKCKEKMEIADENGDYIRFLNYFIKSLINKIK